MATKATATQPGADRSGLPNLLEQAQQATEAQKEAIEAKVEQEVTKRVDRVLTEVMNSQVQDQDRLTREADHQQTLRIEFVTALAVVKDEHASWKADPTRDELDQQFLACLENVARAAQAAQPVFTLEEWNLAYCIVKCYVDAIDRRKNGRREIYTNFLWLSLRENWAKFLS